MFNGWSGSLSFHLLNKLNAGSQVHAEVNELPDDALLLVLLLLQDEHGVVEELLQFLIGEVDAQLLQGVELVGVRKSTNNYIIILYI